MAVLFRRNANVAAAPDPAPDAAAPGLTGSAGSPGPSATAVGGSIDLATVTIEQIVERRLVTAEFQPIVWLDTADVVAYEAYARGPVGSQFYSPRTMFDAAAKAGLTVALDQTAHAAAYKVALSTKLHPSLSLFVNADPSAIGAEMSADFVGVVAAALTRLRILIEVSEQDLAANPSAALAGISRARECGWGISWDHLGATPDSLALMPFVQPDVVKIDVSLIHDRYHPDAARVVNAIIAYAERTGASIMATSIETREHLLTARGMGARLGQGYLFGKPGPLPTGTEAPRHAVPLVAKYQPPDPVATPFEIFAKQRDAAPASINMLQYLAYHLEQRCSIDPEPAVVLCGLPEQQLISGEALVRLQMIARNAAFVAVLIGEDGVHPISGVRMATMATGDRLRDEWNFAVVGPHFAALLTAKIDQDAADSEVAVRYGLTYDRPIVLEAARALLQRFAEAADTKP